MIDQEIFQTIRYFDVLGLPVTSTQIWRSLIQGDPESRVRWGGHALHSLAHVKQALRSSPWLRRRVDSQWGYWHLQGKHHLVRQRLGRHILATRKWRIARWVVKLLAAMPFVRMIAGSGSLALDNTRPVSDLDLFIVVKAGRIWTARLFLVIAAQLTGRRRKYWNRLAPDKVCLNHYITDDHLAVSPDIRNVHTAVTYTHLVPLFGLDVFARFQQLNAAWMRRFLMYPEPTSLPHRYMVQSWPVVMFSKKLLETVLLEPIGELIERWAGKVQRRAIVRHTRPGRSGRVAVSDRELAFHPDSQVPAILRQYEEEVGQKALW